MPTRGTSAASRIMQVPAVTARRQRGTATQWQASRRHCVGQELGSTVVLEGCELGGAIVLEGRELGSMVVLEGCELGGAAGWR